MASKYTLQQIHDAIQDRLGDLMSVDGPAVSAYKLPNGTDITHITVGELIAALTSVFGPNLGNLVAMVIHVVVFLTKVIAMIFLQQLLRWSLPRFRYDQVMNLGWKIMLPLSLANIAVTGLVILLIDEVVR